MTSQSGNLGFIELFAGVGGFRLGLEAAGWTHSWSNQWEPGSKIQYASSCYIKNFGNEHHSNEDIAQVSTALLESKTVLPIADLIVGGFPCQDYSVAKSRSSANGLEGKKGVLWWEILKVVNHVKPKAILLENVDRLLASPTGQRGRDFAVMLRSLADCGYSIEWRVINSADYGFPQRRKRIFIVALRVEFQKAFTEPQKSTINTALEILDCGPIERFNLERDLLALSNTFGAGKKSSAFKGWGFFDGEVVVTANVEARKEAQAKLGDVLVAESEVPSHYWVDETDIHRWEFLKGAKSLSRTTKDGFSYSYSEGQMTFPDALDRPSRTILTGEGGPTPSRFKHLVNIDGKFRRLVPIELERLNGFPDNWTEYTSEGNRIPDSRRAFLMGNALVIGLVARLGIALRTRLLESDD